VSAAGVAGPPEQCDLAVVGAGIVGLAVACELKRRRPGLAVTVLEREDDIATHQTARSSGVVHAGIYYKPGSLKARLCVEGARELYDLCERAGVAHERCGKVIVARDASELGRLDELERRGRDNGVPGLRRLDALEIEELEPHCRGVAGLHSPQIGAAEAHDARVGRRARLAGQPCRAPARAEHGEAGLGLPASVTQRDPPSAGAGALHP